MNWEALGAIAELIGGLGVIVTLGYLALQIRGSNRVASAQSRQSMSAFAMSISRFHAEFADRCAKVGSSEQLTPGDKEFQYWNHMQMLTYGESYYHQFQLGLMPDSHWKGFSNWIEAYSNTNGFDEFWEQEGNSFALDYCAWINERLVQREKPKKSV
ncbi:MAG: hypothetical protein ABJN62_19500 [Halioglobus sp.]